MTVGISFCCNNIITKRACFLFFFLFPKPSLCKLINRILINVQQICYFFEMNNNQEVFIRPVIFLNGLKKSFRRFCITSMILPLKFLQQIAIITFDYIIDKKTKIFYVKN